MQATAWDKDDNIYVAMYAQARVMVFNRLGWPVGQILMPDRDTGRNFGTTHPMIRPGTDDIYICTFDDLGSVLSGKLNETSIGRLFVTN